MRPKGNRLEVVLYPGTDKREKGILGQITFASMQALACIPALKQISFARGL